MAQATIVRFVTKSAHGLSNVKRAHGVPLDFLLVTSVQIGKNRPLRFEPPKADRYTIANLPPRRQLVRLPVAMAIRLGQFVEMCLVRGEQEYDCFNFMDYLMGHISTPIGRPQHGYNGPNVQPAQIALARPYVILDDKFRPIHGMIGLGSGYVLGVNGINHTLTICAATPLMRAYGGTHIGLVTGICP